MMRLLNVETLILEWFVDSDIPSYLILSHRWQGSETSLQDFIARDELDAGHVTPGIRKVVQFADYAKKQKAKYVWVDTMCIDKESSAELQEAINSMYRWYERAKECVVYLDDMKVRSEEKANPHNKPSVRQRFMKSEWFLRGWTLQELVSPQEQVFVDKDWTVIGSRDDLMDSIISVTAIDHSCFGNRRAILREPVAKRMSWMSSRRTSRIEDLAYCMLGIFGVSLGMFYGEGTNAFLRLQKAIIQEIDDESIFVWSFEVPDSVVWPRADSVAFSLSTVLAPHPAFFSVCSDQRIENDNFVDRVPHQVTTKGIQIEHYERRKTQFDDNLTIVLNCKANGKRVCIPIERVGKAADGSNKWRRVRPNEVVTFAENMLHRPPTAWEQFNNQLNELMFTPTRPNLGTGHSFSPSLRSHQGPGRARQEFEQEFIKYKVYVE